MLPLLPWYGVKCLNLVILQLLSLASLVVPKFAVRKRRIRLGLENEP